MLFYLIVALEILLIQLGGAYLRYLPFSSLLSAKQTNRLWRRCLLWSLAAWMGYAGSFWLYGFSILLYKLLLAVGWLPFFLFTVYAIPQRLAQHIFVFGMQTCWFLFLHALSTSLLPYFTPAAVEMQIIQQAGIYLLLFLLLLWPGYHCFRRLLPSRRIISAKPYAYYIALLPFCLCASHIALSLDNHFHASGDLSSRLFLILGFFLLYRYILLEAKEQHIYIRQNQKSHHLSQQLRSLQDHALLMKESQSRLSILRHDMRHHIRLLHTMLENGRYADAEKLLQTFNDDLGHTAVSSYCQNTIINAVLSIYIHRTEELNIPFTQKSALPAQLPGQNDIAILLSNLLENALLANLKQPEGKRRLNLKIQLKKQQLVLLLENQYDLPLHTDSAGLPCTSRAGHGTGIASITSFASKYNAFVRYTHPAGLVRVTMYWTLPVPAADPEVLQK